MPKPTSATTILRPDLGSVAMEFMENQTDFIGMQVLPPFEVAEQSGDYPVIPLEALANTPDTKRAPRGNYSRDDYEFELDNYSCAEHGYEEPVDEVEVKLYKRYFDVEKIASLRAIKTVLRAQEKRIADMVFNESNFTAHAITNEWDDATNAVPISDVNTGRLAIQAATGLDPNTLIISYSTFLDLGLVAQLIDRIKYTHPEVVKGEVSAVLLAQALGVQKVLVGKGLYNSAKKGQTASMARLWDHEYAMLCVTDDGNDIETPCLGKTFRWGADDPGNVIESYREESVRSDIIRARQHTDEELINTTAAYLLSNITT